ncbi:hypothetical protein CEXT_373641 [Caerostris extrusa]|uniref:Uncharacterized protein n=1 Tax=Caerostris extrusa TaxID=172846 RepID=A0AAV4QTV9_CAEEX|nr:hypothetical protein CEXT_373641 [Caerostris extrusa]
MDGFLWNYWEWYSIELLGMIFHMEGIPWNYWEWYSIWMVFHGIIGNGIPWMVFHGIIGNGIPNGWYSMELLGMIPLKISLESVWGREGWSEDSAADDMRKGGWSVSEREREIEERLSSRTGDGRCGGKRGGCLQKEIVCKRGEGAEEKSGTGRGKEWGKSCSVRIRPLLTPYTDRIDTGCGGVITGVQ